MKYNREFAAIKRLNNIFSKDHYQKQLNAAFILGISLFLSIIMFIIFMFTSTVRAESIFSIRTGYGEHLSNASCAWLTEGVYEYRKDDNAFEASLGYYSVKLRGQDILGRWDTRGRLHVVPIFAGYKRYFGDLYASLSAGRVFMPWFQEYYEGSATTHDEWAGRIILGINLKHDWSIEVMRMMCDLNIESGTTQLGIAEDKSNLNSYWIMFKHRF